MNTVRAAGLAGLALVATALPVAAYALTEGAGPTSSPRVRPAALDATDRAEPEPAEPAEVEAVDDEAAEPAGPGHPGQAGRAHAAAMKAWARCVADAASGPRAPGSTTPPKLACPDKPLGPGRARHAGATGPGKSGQHGSPAHGKGPSHRH
jgi:hypothetical protein